MENSGIKGVIFDLGWTLIDFAGDIEATVTQRALDVGDFLLNNGFDVDGAAVYESYRREMAVLWQAGMDQNYEYPARLAMLRALRLYLKRDDAARLAHGAVAASFENLIPQWHLYADTLSTLAALRDAGYRLGCISNTNDGTHVWRLVDRFGLRSWLSPIYTSEEFGLRKPHVGIFQKVLDDWGMLPQVVVIVGDTLNADVLGAHNAGMRGVWVDRGLANPWSNNAESKAFIQPDARIEQLSELPSLLTHW